MLKKIALFGLISLNIAHAFAAPATEVSVQKALKLTNINDVVSQSIQSSQTVLTSQSVQLVRQYTGHNVLTTQDNQAAQQIAQVLYNNTNSILKDLNIQQIAGDVYRRYYTEEELKAYIKFLETPEGQSINRKLPLITQNVTQDVVKRLQSNPDVKTRREQSNQQVKDILSKLPKAQPAAVAPAKS